MEEIYRTHGQFWTCVVPKADTIPDWFTGEEARRLVKEGGTLAEWAGYYVGRAQIVVAAVGAYHFAEALQASRRLAESRLPHTVAYLLEPGRFRAPRSEREEAHHASASLVETLFPAHVQSRIFLTHTRPETILGVLSALHTGSQTCGLGYLNEGGTLNTPGMLFRNRCTWAHCLDAVARLLKLPREQVLREEELDALDGRRSPHGIIIPALTE